MSAPTAPALTTDELLTTTRNVRKRLDLERPVPRELVLECLDLAFQAPNGSNQQSWEWLVVDDAGVRKQLAECNRAALEHFQAILARDPRALDANDVGRNLRMPAISTSVYHLIENLERVPVHVIPLVRGRLERANSFYQASVWGSIWPAVWGFMLALRSRGLGSALTTLHLWKEREVAERLGIPYDDYTQAGLIPVAWTQGRFRPAQRLPAREIVRWNRW